MFLLIKSPGLAGLAPAIMFLPPLASLMIFGKTKGMLEAFILGVNTSFVLLAFVAILFLIYAVVSFINRDKKPFNVKKAKR